MKKIKVSSIERMSDVAVIELTPSFIARSIKATLKLEECANILRTPETFYNEQTGKKEISHDEEGNVRYRYSKGCISEEMSKVLCEEILPFMQELCDAFEEA